MADVAITSILISKRQARLRRLGWFVMLVGLISAGLVYWRGRRLPDWRNDPAMASYYREELRQAQIVYGQMGLAAVEVLEALRQPDTQAILIGAVSALAASGCFLLARLPAFDLGKPADQDEPRE